MIQNNEEKNYISFRSVKLLEEKYLEAKKAFEVIKSQLSHIERRVTLQMTLVINN